MADTAAQFVQLVRDVAQVDQRAKPLLASLKARRKKLEDAIAASKGAVIEVVSGELEADKKKTERELATIDELLKVDLRQIQRDESFVDAKGSQIEMVATKLSDWQDQLTEQFDAVDTLFDKADKATEAQKSGKAAALREAAELDRYIDNQSKPLRQLLDDSSECAEQAVLAFVDRDSETLTKARAKAEALNVSKSKDVPDRLAAEVDSFLKRWKGKGLGAEVEKQFETFATKLRVKIDRARPWIKESQDNVASVDRYKLPKPDPRKALQNLDLPASVLGKVTKAMTPPKEAMVKAFDGIAKELKLKTTGKQMVEALIDGKII